MLSTPSCYLWPIGVCIIFLLFTFVMFCFTESTCKRDLCENTRCRSLFFLFSPFYFSIVNIYDNSDLLSNNYSLMAPLCLPVYFLVLSLIWVSSPRKSFLLFSRYTRIPYILLSILNFNWLRFIYFPTRLLIDMRICWLYLT